MSTLRALLLRAQADLAAVDSPRLDAELLLGHVLGLTRAQLVTRGDDEVAPADAQRYAALLLRRMQGEPVAYLRGGQGFWTLQLKVDPAVLVPRPETELLVEWALERLAVDAAARVADLGTGSGAIALALASERPQALVVATDLSGDALRCARDNAQALGLTRVVFRHGCWTAALAGERYDLLISNPPYIAADDAHLPGLRHEPYMALSDGGDGLGALRQIVREAPAHLHAGGWLLLEHGYDQAAAVRGLLTQAGFAQVQTRRDLNGHERASGGVWS